MAPSTPQIVVSLRFVWRAAGRSGLDAIRRDLCPSSRLTSSKTKSLLVYRRQLIHIMLSTKMLFVGFTTLLTLASAAQPSAKPPPSAARKATLALSAWPPLQLQPPRWSHITSATASWPIFPLTPQPTSPGWTKTQVNISASAHPTAKVSLALVYISARKRTIGGNWNW
jgi:hypothetical protein